MRVRAAEPADHGAIRTLTLDVYVGEGFSDPDQAAGLGDVAAHAAAGEVLVAEAPGMGIAGSAWLVAGGAPPARLAREGEAEIRLLATSPEARGRGVGAALVGACVDRARARGLRRMGRW